MKEEKTKFKIIELSKEDEEVPSCYLRISILESKINNFVSKIKPENILNAWWAEGWRFIILYKEEK